MKVLDLFCGRGGWSKPFIEDGDEVWGIDIKDYGYPGKLILSDIRELDGYGFSDFDFIIGSPPCTEFSAPKHVWGPSRGSIPKPQEGVALVKKAETFIEEAKPHLWALENIDNMKKWYSPKPIWKFRISVGGRRFLWGNLTIPLASEYRFNHSFGCTREVRLKTGRPSIRNSSRRAEIPYPIARFIADTVKQQ